MSIRTATLQHLLDNVDHADHSRVAFRLMGTFGIRSAGWTPDDRSQTLDSDGVDVILRFGEGMPSAARPGLAELKRNLIVEIYGARAQDQFARIEEESWAIRRVLDDARVPFTFLGVSAAAKFTCDGIGGEFYGAPGTAQYPQQHDWYTFTMRIPS